jgi:alpha-1,2-mannosyltransferase
MTERAGLTSRVALGLSFVVIVSSGIYFARQSGTDPRAYSNDFNVYYHAASETMSGRGPYQHSLAEWTPYLYPPLLAELMIPLALLPLAAAAFIWFLISLLSVAAAAFMSAAMCVQSRAAKAGDAARSCEPRFKSAGQPGFNPGAGRILIAAIAIVLLIRFALDNFNLGQVNPLVGALSVAHVYFNSRGKRGLSALAFALAASIKLTPVVLIAYHVAKRRLKFAAACLGLLATLTVLSFLPFGWRAPETFKVFFNRTVRNEQGYDLSYAGNQSLRGATARLARGDASGGQSAREPTSAVTIIISVALLSLAMFAARIAPDEMAAAAPLFCCLVILSPLSWKAHFVVLILPAAYLACRALRSSETRRAYLMAVLIVVFSLFNLTSPKLLGLPAAEWADAHSLVFAGALVIYLACIWQASRRFVNLNEGDQPETD